MSEYVGFNGIPFRNHEITSTCRGTGFPLADAFGVNGAVHLCAYMVQLAVAGKTEVPCWATLSHTRW